MAQPLETSRVNSLETLLETGWEERATQEEPRLSEAIGLYGHLGFEVRRQPFDPGLRSGFSRCPQSAFVR